MKFFSYEQASNSLQKVRELLSSALVSCVCFRFCPCFTLSSHRSSSWASPPPIAPSTMDAAAMDAAIDSTCRHGRRRHGCCRGQHLPPWTPPPPPLACAARHGCHQARKTLAWAARPRRWSGRSDMGVVKHGR